MRLAALCPGMASTVGRDCDVSQASLAFSVRFTIFFACILTFAKRLGVSLRNGSLVSRCFLDQVGRLVQCSLFSLTVCFAHVIVFGDEIAAWLDLCEVCL